MEVSKPTLLVTIDTEEDGAWSSGFVRDGHTVSNVRGVPRFQQLCQDYQVIPTYLIDAPVVEDEASVEMLRGYQDGGAAEVGAHVHPWCNPPCEEELGAGNSFLCNLPEDLQRAKIEWLTETIADRVGRRPTSFRAGRYGLSHVGFDILESLGYVVDSSIIPFSDFRGRGGPDFRDVPGDPYFPSPEDLRVPADQPRMLEVPVTVGYNRYSFRRANALYNLAHRSPFRQLRAVGLLDRTAMVQRIKLSPEQSTVAQMKRLIKLRCSQGAPCLVLMFHSSSLEVGHSPYVSTPEELDRFHDRLEQVFAYCCEELQLRAVGLSEFAESYAETHSLPSRN